MSLLCVLVHFPFGVSAKDVKPEKPVGWGYVRRARLEVRSKPTHRGTSITRLGQGALVPVWRLQSKRGESWAQVRGLDLVTLTPKVGWVESSQIEVLSADRFSADAELFRLLGGAYLEDFTAAHTEIARFLLRQRDRDPTLVCFIASRDLGSARLVAFLPYQGKFVPGPSLEFVLSEVQAGITALEVRDLMGDGNECLVTSEPFRLGPETRGVDVVIRRLEGKVFKTLWKAPVEFRNLGSFPPRPHVLQPAEKNIGAEATVTTGEVSFRTRGTFSEPVWKGKVEFYVVGREQPVESVPIEKVCPWNGTEFAPLQ